MNLDALENVEGCPFDKSSNRAFDDCCITIRKRIDVMC
jgi:hypothetical protein